MPQAIIDIGTNTLILLIGKVGRGKKLEIIHDEAIITRLGQGLNDYHFFCEEAFTRTFDALKKFKKTCEKFKVKNIKAVGTAACRISANIDVLKHKMKTELQIPLEVISGNDEANYTFQSAYKDFSQKHKKLIVVDIGGGSTEIIYGPLSSTNKNPASTISLPIGSVKITEHAQPSDPITKLEFNALVKFIRNNIKDELDFFYDENINLDKYHLVATAGTATTLYAIKEKMKIYDSSQVNGGLITKSELENIINHLAKLTLQERQKLPGLEPLRADVILSGAVLLYELLSYFKKDEFTISDRGLRFGAFYKNYL